MCNLTLVELSYSQRILKRSFDLVVSALGLISLFPLIFLLVVASTVDTRQPGIFAQARIGRHGKPFRVHKVRTMRDSASITTTVTVDCDPRITRFGVILRRFKLDELPQLWDVLIGNMSLVGPRPDVAGWADKLVGAERSILSLRPGITGPASLYFRNEEVILSSVERPEEYNRSTIWPKKVELNIQYLNNWTLRRDLALMLETLHDKNKHR